MCDHKNEAAATNSIHQPHVKCIAKGKEAKKQQSLFISMDNVILPPHCAGSTWESNVRITRGAAQAVLDVIEGRIPDSQYVYNKELLNGNPRT